MKKYFILILSTCFLFDYYSFSQTYPKDLISIQYYLWENENWVNWEYFEFDYNDNDLLNTLIIWSWDGFMWKYFEKIEYKYNERKNLIERQYYVRDFSNTVWGKSQRYSYVYNDDNLLIETIYQPSTISYQYGTRELIEYNERKLKNQWIHQTYVDTLWVNKDMEVYKYLANDSIENIQYFTFNSNINDWFENAKEIFNYYSDKTEKNRYKFYYSNWILSTQDIIYFDKNHKIIEIFKNKLSDSNIMEYNARYSYLYDSSGNMIEELRQSWNDTLWINQEKQIMKYDEFNRLIEYVWLTWKDSIWVNEFKEVLKYKPFTSTNNDILFSNFFHFSLSPNPASNLISIKFNNENNFQNLHLKIFDIFGNEIKSIPYPAPDKESNEINMDISELQAGVYFIKSVIGSKVEIAKFVKMY